MMDRARLAELNRLLELKRLLADGTLTREEALTQLQADGTDRGSDRGSDCASERSASPAPAIGVPVYGAGTGNAGPGTHGNSTHVGGMETTDPFVAPTTHDNDPHQLIAERLSRARVSFASAASIRLSVGAPTLTKSASSASSGLAVDAESSRVAELVARVAEIQERIEAAVACEDFEEAARLKKELAAAEAEALAAWEAELAEARDQVDKSKSALDAAEESLGVAKQSLSEAEEGLKEVVALHKENMAAIRAAAKDEDFTKAAELKATAVGLDRRLAAAKEAVAAKKEALAAAKAAKQKRLTELTDAKLMLDGKMPKAAQAASRRRPSVGPKPGGEAVGFCLRCPPINRKATVIALLVLLALAGGLAGLIYFAVCRFDSVRNGDLCTG